MVSNRYNDGEQSEVFKLNFIHRNLLTDYHEKMLSWCKETLDSLHIEEVEKEIIVGRPGRSDMPDSSISPSDFFEELQGFNGSVIEVQIYMYTNFLCYFSYFINEINLAPSLLLSQLRHKQ